MLELLQRLLILVLRLSSGPVDDYNAAMAEEYGVDSFSYVDDHGELHEKSCHRTKLKFQPYNCKLRMRWALLTISNREQAGTWHPERRWTGIHRGDSSHSGNVRYWADHFGRLRWWCPAHWSDTGMSTVGPHGLMYGYNVQRVGMPGNCVPWWIFSLNAVSARTAAKIYASKCGGVDQRPEGKRGWCPTRKAIIRTRNKARRKKYVVGQDRRG